MRVVLFDLDDTLFDHQYCSRAGLAAVQRTYPGRIHGSIEDVEATYHELLEQWHGKVLAGLISIDESRLERFRLLLSSTHAIASDDESRAAARCYRDAYDAAYRPVPGAIEVLQSIKVECPIGIVTNHVVSEQVKKVATIGVEPFVNELVVSEEVGVAKPDARVFEAALSLREYQTTRSRRSLPLRPLYRPVATGLGIRAIWLNRYDRPCPDSSLATEIRSLEPVDKIVNLILSPS